MTAAQWTQCPDCVTCEGCGATAYCLADAISFPACDHDRPLCPDCNLEHCPDCRLQAEHDMHQSGNYDPRSDPFHDHAAPKPVNRIARDGGYSWDGSWVEVNPQGHSA